MQNATDFQNFSFEQLLEDLSDDFPELAKETKAFQRSRKVKSPEELLRLNFLYSGLDFSFRSVAHAFTLLFGRTISDTAVQKRILLSYSFITRLLKSLFASTFPFKSLTERRVRIVDGTSLKALAARGHSNRAHISIDAFSLEMDEVILTNKRIGETFKNFTFRAGELVMGDRGYCHHLGIYHVLMQGGHVLVRLNPNTIRLLTPEGERFELRRKLLSHRPHQPITFEVMISGKSKTEPISGWVHAVRLPRKEALKQRIKYKKERKSVRKKPDPLELYLRGWVIVFTTVPPEELSSSACLELYRYRWQVEMYIKRFKSLLGVGSLPTKEDSPTTKVYMAGKFLYALLLEKRARRKLEKDEKEKPPQRLLWRGLIIIKMESICLLLEPWRWVKKHLDLALPLLYERSRSRSHQELPQEVKSYLLQDIGA